MKLFKSLLALSLLLIGNIEATSQNSKVIWEYNLSDGSTIHNMSDNGKWAVAYGVSDATSAYAFPKLFDFTNHTYEEILTTSELNSGIECYVNDVSDDASVVAGCYAGKPAFWNATTKVWTSLPLAQGNMGGRVEAVTPDGIYAVGACTNGGFDEVPVMWNISTQQIIPLENLPTCDLSGGFQEMMRLTGISADGRYLVGCVSYSYPSDVLYFLYDRTEKSWDAIAFDFIATSKQFIPRDVNVRTLDGICISPNGKWVAGVTYSTEDTRNPYRYNVETKEFENFNGPDDLDKGCVTIDNNGTIYAATPAVNPSRSLYILHKGYWYGLDELLKQNYTTDFYTQTGFEATGLCVAVSADCKTMAGMAYISHENYQITLPTTFSEACESVNLLDTYNVSVRSGAKVQKISNITLNFTRDIDILASKEDIQLLDEAGNLVRAALKFEVDMTSQRTLNVGFKTTTLEVNKQYSVLIPSGSISIKGDATKTNKEIILNYVGLGDEGIVLTQVAPADKSTLGHLDINTNPLIFSFNVDVKVKNGAQALVYRNDEAEAFTTLNLQHGTTRDSYNMVLAYPSTTLYLYKDNTYHIVIPASSLTDAAGASANAQLKVSYVGSYERTYTSDDTHIYLETFEMGMSNVMLFDGDEGTPTSEMQAWNFTSNVPWIHAADDDYTNPCAASHSMYSPAGPSDDWMVTPKLYIPDDKCVLSFDAQSYRKAKADFLQVIVYASEADIYELNASVVADMEFKGDLLFNKQLSPGNTEGVLANEWETIEIPLAPYAGKSIYVAFVNKNNDQSALFVANVQVKHDADFNIVLSGVPETVIAQQSQVIKGTLIVNDAQKSYNDAHIQLLDADNNVLEQLQLTNLSLNADTPCEFAFTTPLPLNAGEICRFSINVNLDNGESTATLTHVIQNLAFKPTKRVILEENTGMGCQNCPLGHLALEHLQALYPQQFIPIAYHTYTGDPLESGMTDYAQYFLGLSAAPSAIIQRNPLVSAPMVSYTENGITDYTFHSRQGDAWTDLVAKELTTDTWADLAIACTHDAQSGSLSLHYAFTSALNLVGTNVALLTVITEDGITGYQSNGFYTTTDPDLGAWQKGGLYGKSTVIPYTFNDVARALYPANAYNGKTGLIPTTLTAGQAAKGTLTINLATDAPYVKEPSNCKVTLVAIDVNSGAVINAARVKIGEAMTAINATTTAPHSAVPTRQGIRINTTTPVVATLYDAQGTHILTRPVNSNAEIPLQQRGLVLVKITNGTTTTVHKVMR